MRLSNLHRGHSLMMSLNFDPAQLPLCYAKIASMHKFYYFYLRKGARDLLCANAFMCVLLMFNYVHKVAHLQAVVVNAVLGIFNNTNGSLFTS